MGEFERFAIAIVTAARQHESRDARFARVVEYPRLLWWLILNGIMLRIRPRRSAAAYREIWTDEGSPLMIYSRELAAAVADRLEQHYVEYTRSRSGRKAIFFHDPDGNAIEVQE